MKQLITALALLVITNVSMSQTTADNDFKNMRTFTTTGNFLIPKGVTKVMVEIWGAGGGATTFGGGGGGAYARAYIDVQEGNTLIAEPGVGGSGSLTSANSGQQSGISYKVGAGNPSVLIRVSGGGGSINSGNTAMGGTGGSTIEVRVASIGYFSMPGQDGETFQDFSRQTPTGMVTTRIYGKGGNAGNSLNSGGRGAITDGPTLSNIRYGTEGKLPGGGGGASHSTKGYNGANGMIIIYF